MSSISSLKREARAAESREDWIEAIELYGRAVAKAREEGAIPFEISLYNRIGDLYLELDDTSQAVYHYLLAAEQYAEEEMHPSAVALCRKVLRVAPDQVDAYRQLAKLHVQTGLVADARREFERYLDGIRETGEIRGAVPDIADLVEELSEEPVDLDEARRLSEQNEWEEAFRRIVAAWEGEEPTEAAADGPEADEAEIVATDAARELAAEQGIELAELEGSGRDGRIVKADVEVAIAEREEAAAEADREDQGERPADSTIPGLLVELEAELTEAEWSLDEVPPSGEAGGEAEDGGPGTEVSEETAGTAAGPSAEADEREEPRDAGTEEAGERAPEAGREQPDEHDAEPAGAPDAEEAPGLAAEAAEEPKVEASAGTGDEAGTAEPTDAVDAPDLDEFLQATEEGWDEPAEREAEPAGAPDAEEEPVIEEPVGPPVEAESGTAAEDAAVEAAGEPPEAGERIDPAVLVAAADALSRPSVDPPRLRSAAVGVPALLPAEATAAAEAGTERSFPTREAPWRRAWSRRESVRERAAAVASREPAPRPAADLPGGIAAASRRPGPSLLWLADAMAEAVAASRGEPIHLRRALGPARERERAAARALEEAARPTPSPPALAPASVGAPALLPAEARAAVEAGVDRNRPTRTPPWRRAWSRRETVRERAAAGAPAEEARRPGADLTGGIAARSRRPAPSLLWLADAMAEAVAASRGEPIYLRRALGPARERERAAARALEETARTDRPGPALAPAAVGAPALLPDEATAAATAGVEPRRPPRAPPWRRAWSRRESARERAAADGRPARAGLAAARGSAPWRDPEPGGVRVAPRRTRPSGPDGPLFGTPGRVDYLPAGAEADGGGEAAAAGLDWLAGAVETILEPGREAPASAGEAGDAVADREPPADEETQEPTAATVDAEATTEDLLEKLARETDAELVGHETSTGATGQASEEPEGRRPAGKATGSEPAEAGAPAEETDREEEADDETDDREARADAEPEEIAATADAGTDARERLDETVEASDGETPEPEGTEEEARWIAGPRPVTEPEAARRLWDAVVEAGPSGAPADHGEDADEAGASDASDASGEGAAASRDQPVDEEAAAGTGGQGAAPGHERPPESDRVAAADDRRPEPETPAGGGEEAAKDEAADDAADEGPDYGLPEPEPGPAPKVELSASDGPDFTALLEHIGWLNEDASGRSVPTGTSNGKDAAVERTGNGEAVARASTGAPWKRGPSANGGGTGPNATTGDEDAGEEDGDGEPDFTEILHEIGWLEEEDRPRSS